ncbi:MAG TPA: S49 family peptidase [Acidocella sp.]|jgi:signal peptide peptidase SppA|uniref:S49 family peptidase n=1 Tax=Acidocella sp. TaxID=50710 RepID=UPI002CE0D49B|nr:S49 family peptidase [Acidocella sp.]HVE20646.1 S49 family peptidase [Acidocella sp.]
MHHRFPHLAQRMFNVPLALHPAKAEIVMAALADRLGIAHLFNAGAPVALGNFEMDEDDRAEDRAYLVQNGVAIIPVEGCLVQKLGSLRPYSGMTGYDGIRYNFLDAWNDDDVKAIVLDIDSPGGEVAGCFDLADTIFRARGRKPIWAMLNENAFSAAYAIASACDQISVPRTGGTGSIGVISMIADISKALSEGGITVNIIQFGARKADGSEVLPLSTEARARFQADVNTIGQLFVNTVARNRKLKASAVAAQQATTYLGQDGLRAGLADMVAAPDAAFRALLKSLKT